MLPKSREVPGFGNCCVVEELNLEVRAIGPVSDAVEVTRHYLAAPPSLLRIVCARDLDVYPLRRLSYLASDLNDALITPRTADRGH